MLEETARMLFDDKELAETIKNSRHNVVKIIKSEKKLDRLLLLHRGSEHDVFRDTETSTEKNRNDLFSILRANSKRAQESLRMMEEYSKLLFPLLSVEFKKIRFDMYNIEKQLSSLALLKEFVNDEKLRIVVIYSVGEKKEDEISKTAENLLDSGAGVLILMKGNCCDDTIIETAEKLIPLFIDKKALLLIESRSDLAMISGADGVFLNEGDMRINSCRKITGQSFIIGKAVNLNENVNMEKNKSANFYVAGPVFEKERDNIGKLGSFISVSDAYVICFGGIKPENIELAVKTGITGFAFNYDKELNKTNIKDLIKRIESVIKS